jgi:dihydroxyacetone kinase phosphoprotein-dependent L subunit
MTETLENAGAGAILVEVARVIIANKAWLSEIDGKIGDGDHGVNMAKGFARAADLIAQAERIGQRSITLDHAMATLSDVLLTEIGGSMGPLYGLMFEDMAASIAGKTLINAHDFVAMLHAGLDGVLAVGAAKVGDKTLIDTLVPAIAAFDAGVAQGFANALAQMAEAAETGRDSTIDLVARVGRAARLGERSRGVLDAGATSCCLILVALAKGTTARLKA